MTADREQTRRDAPQIRAYIENAGYEVLMLSDGSRTAMPMDTAPVIDELDAILAELEQAERERDEATDAWQLEIKRALDAEASLEPVPALVEAMKRVREQVGWIDHGEEGRSMAVVGLSAFAEFDAALARYEQSLGKP